MSPSTTWSKVINGTIFTALKEARPASTQNCWIRCESSASNIHRKRKYAQVLSTVDQQRQLALIRQMERHTRDQAYFLFLYNPIQLYAVNKAVTFVPYISALRFAQTTVSAQHWSVRKQKAAIEK